MKKILGLILLFTGIANANPPQDWNYIPVSSYTDAQTPGAVFFSSGTVQFVGVTISSPAPGSYVAFYRSTSAVFTPDIATQTLLNTDYASQEPIFIPFFEMQNSSFTYFSKQGTAKITMWIRNVKEAFDSPGFGFKGDKGLPYSGQR